MSLNDVPVSLVLSHILLRTRLDLFADGANRPLLNNGDLDQDENFSIARPRPCTYNTVDILDSAVKCNSGLFSILHVNFRSILSKLSDLENLI